MMMTWIWSRAMRALIQVNGALTVILAMAQIGAASAVAACLADLITAAMILAIARRPAVLVRAAICRSRILARPVSVLASLCTWRQARNSLRLSSLSEAMISRPCFVGSWLRATRLLAWLQTHYPLMPRPSTRMRLCQHRAQRRAQRRAQHQTRHLHQRHRHLRRRQRPAPARRQVLRRHRRRHPHRYAMCSHRPNRP